MAHQAAHAKVVLISAQPERLPTRIAADQAKESKLFHLPFFHSSMYLSPSLSEMPTASDSMFMTRIMAVKRNAVTASHRRITNSLSFHGKIAQNCTAQLNSDDGCCRIIKYSTSIHLFYILFWFCCKTRYESYGYTTYDSGSD